MKKPTISRWECSNCSLPEPLGAAFPSCGRCEVVRYCDKECQKQHWKKGGHRDACLTPDQRKPQLAAPPHSAVKKDAEKGPTCVICCDPIAHALPTTLPCSHVFHTRCLQTLRTCPLCRARFDARDNQKWDGRVTFIYRNDSTFAPVNHLHLR